MIAARQIAFGKGGSSKLPYAYEVEYVRNEGIALTKVSWVVFDDYIPSLDDDFTLRLSDATYPFTDGYGLFGLRQTTWRRYQFGLYTGNMWVGEKDRQVTSLALSDIEEVHYSDRKAYVNGVYGNDFSDATQEPTTPLLIFGLGNQYVDNPTYVTLYNFKHLKVIRNGEVIMDVIPVVDFDGKACLYNKASGRFYYASSIGGDFGLIAGPRKDEIAYTAKDYVQDGLIHQYDGIENVGYGEHSYDAVVWKDLVGGNDAKLTGDSNAEYLLWTDNAFEMRPGVARYSGFASSSTITIPNEFTMSGVIQSDESWLSTNGSIMGVCPVYEGGGVVVVYAIKHSGIGCHFNGVIDLGKNVTSIPIERTLVFAHNVLKIYTGGQLVLEKVYDGTPEPIGLAFKIRPIWHAYYDWQAPYKGFKFMVYNRALSAEEIAHNYSIDKARFGL